MAENDDRIRRVCFYDEAKRIPRESFAEHRSLRELGAAFSGRAFPCGGEVRFVVHDKRGCVLCCEQHARWRGTTSRLLGHDDGCLDMGAKDEHVTDVGPEPLDLSVGTEERTLVIVEGKRFWVPVWAMDLACSVTDPIDMAVYEIALTLAQKRLAWREKAEKSREKVDEMLDRLKRKHGK